MAEFDPALPHQGPFPLPNDRLRIDTIRNTPEGPAAKVTIIDGSQGWILEQHVFDARRRLVASSVASGHRRDPLSNLVMPTVVQINCPAAQLDLADRVGQRADQPAGGRQRGVVDDAELSWGGGGGPGHSSPQVSAVAPPAVAPGAGQLPAANWRPPAGK